MPYVDLRRALDAYSAGRAAGDEAFAKGEFDTVFRALQAFGHPVKTSTDR